MLPVDAWPSRTVALNGRPGPLGEALGPVPTKPENSWIFVAYDQLNEALLTSINEAHGPLGLVFIESSEKASRRPYHQQKLALLLSNMRHFAVEMVQRGWPVLYLSTTGTYAQGLEDAMGSTIVHAIEPAERELRRDLSVIVADGRMTVHEHEGWLTKRAWFDESVGVEPPFRMDAFYRRVRKETGWLMVEGQPLGGGYSHDADNRKPWKGEPAAPEPPKFATDSLDEEVQALVERCFAGHPGSVDLTALPTTAEQAKEAMAYGLTWLTWFGPYEDAMSERSRTLFHTRLAPLFNLHRVLPVDAVEGALTSKAPLNSVEGFVRQLVWREYVHHVHVVTDGFRTLNVHREPAVRGARWGAWEHQDGELHPNHLEQRAPLFPAYWGQESGLRCLDANVQAVMEDGWTHHIPRLMVLGNLANLLDVDPRELTDWFHAAFIDAFDWVVEPNVLGMGTFALGTAMMTKPYVSGAAYIHRMSDHCSSCSFHPKKTCPITRLYWAYLNRHRDAFSNNHRMSMAMRNAAKRSDEVQAEDAAVFGWVQSVLLRGDSLTLADGDLRAFMP